MESYAAYKAEYGGAWVVATCIYYRGEYAGCLIIKWNPVHSKCSGFTNSVFISEFELTGFYVTELCKRGLQNDPELTRSLSSSSLNSTV